jgi:hypothetical protein
VQIGGNIGSTELTGYKLVVQGAIKATSISIEDVATADYVFSDDYELMPLEEVSKFVDENQHLPGIASASKMKAEGLNIGEFQGQLLKKIEELTLYAVDQDKRIEQLEAALEKAGISMAKGQQK